jgi:hypothetical protein
MRFYQQKTINRPKTHIKSEKIYRFLPRLNLKKQMSIRFGLYSRAI